MHEPIPPRRLWISGIAVVRHLRQHNPKAEIVTTYFINEHSTEMYGKGEVPLTYPAKASATLAIDAVMEGVILVQREPARSVIA